jgi:uncharacterized protein (TIGR04255 family)
MTNYQTLGHLPRSPLVYTIALVEYGQVPAMAEFASRIQEALRPEYPEIGRLEAETLQIGVRVPGQPPEINKLRVVNWTMNTADRAWGIIFSENKLLLHTRAYEHFPQFADRFREALTTIAREAKITHTSTSGIRYIDNIRAIDGLGLSELIQEGFLAPALGGSLERAMSRVEYIYRSQEGQLFLRGYGVANHPGIPADIMELANQLFRNALPIAPVTEEFALLDTDHMYAPGRLESLDVNSVIERLDRLHQGASSAFRRIATKEALDAWKKEDN